MKTKNYANTKIEVETLVNKVILPRLWEKHIENYKWDETIDRASKINFLYGTNHMSALEAFLRLALLDLVGSDNYPSIKEYFKEDK